MVVNFPLKDTPILRWIHTGRYILNKKGKVASEAFVKKNVPEQLQYQVSSFMK